MKDATRRSDSAIMPARPSLRRPRKHVMSTCSICTRRIWLHPVQVIEPEEVPAPRNTWTLCKTCYEALLVEMYRSPVRSALRIRIAMGMVASEYWPNAYPLRVRAYLNDRKWIVFIAVGFMIAMLVHLALIVMIAGLH